MAKYSVSRKGNIKVIFIVLAIVIVFVSIITVAAIASNQGNDDTTTHVHDENCDH